MFVYHTLRQSLPKVQCFQLSATIGGNFALLSLGMIDEQFSRDGNATSLSPLRCEKNIRDIKQARTASAVNKQLLQICSIYSWLCVVCF